MRIAIVDMETLAENWGAVLFRGLAAIAFGLVSLFAPRLSLAALLLAFGVYALVDGIFALVSALRHRGERAPWWMLVLQGIAGVATAVITAIWPGITAIALLYLIAAWAVVTGLFEVVTAIRLRKAIRGEWLLILSGVLSVALGVVLALFPGPGLLALVLWIGAFALVSGALRVTLAIRLRSWTRHQHPNIPSATAIPTR
jgi:uncharacterized membrane protein HdeD (DUF308 family)